MKCFLLFCIITIIYCLKYGTAEMKECFIHLFVMCAKNVTFLYVFHVYTLSSYLRSFQCVLHIPVSMSCVYCVSCICGCIFAVLYCMYMLVKPSFEQTSFWPIYCRRESLHSSLYIPLLSYWLLLCCLTCMYFLMLSVFSYATFMLVSSNMLATFLRTRTWFYCAYQEKQSLHMIQDMSK
jgi:hypothetical protein